MAQPRPGRARARQFSEEGRKPSMRSQRPSRSRTGTAPSCIPIAPSARRSCRRVLGLCRGRREDHRPPPAPQQRQSVYGGRATSAKDLPIKLRVLGTLLGWFRHTHERPADLQEHRLIAQPEAARRSGVSGTTISAASAPLRSAVLLPQPGGPDHKIKGMPSALSSL